MPAEEAVNVPWTRKHDDPRTPLIPQAPRIVYPKDLAELIEICRNPARKNLKAAGSHWALSTAAISDHTFIETHDPRGNHQVMGRTLPEVVPGCLNRAYVEALVNAPAEQRYYLVHVEAGKRVYQLYAELDEPVELEDPTTYGNYVRREFGNEGYGGRWAFATLGGAGGQTVVGALTTGTHGGDFDRPPIADSVLALHLVADGGRHYWIEPGSPALPLADPGKLTAVYGRPEYGGADNFEILHDTDVFDAVLVSAGRFGVIYSVVLRAVPQYALAERRRLVVWQDIKSEIRKAPYGQLFREPDVDNRFLQIAVCLTPHANFKYNLAGVTKRWQVPLADPAPGRAERVGVRSAGADARLQAHVFSMAGRSFPYAYDAEEPGKGAGPSMLERACEDAGFLRGILQTVVDEVEEFVESNGAVVGAGIATIAVVGGAGLLALLAALALIVILLEELIEHFEEDKRLGEHMNDLRNALLNAGPGGATRAAGLFVWQLIALKIFQMMQGDDDIPGAISYAIMDRHHYGNDCEVNVDSVEVFFDALDDRLITFVDLLIAFERHQEMHGRAFVGYVSLRFTGPSRARLGMAKHAVTASVEVACLRDVGGSQELIDYAVGLARHPNIGGLLHWGQRNDCTMAEIEERYGSAAASGSDFGAWRAALARLTDNGRLAAFSSEFTRRAGLEV